MVPGRSGPRAERAGEAGAVGARGPRTDAPPVPEPPPHHWMWADRRWMSQDCRRGGAGTGEATGSGPARRAHTLSHPGQQGHVAVACPLGGLLRLGHRSFLSRGDRRKGVAGTTGGPGITSSGQPQGTKGDRTPGLPPGSALPRSLCDLSDSLTLSQPTFLNRQVGPRSEGAASATIIMPSSQMSKLRLRQVKCCLRSAAGGLQNWTDPLNSHECWCHRQGPL